MSNITKIADAIARDPILNGWERMSGYAPEFDLRDLSCKKVCIIPLEVDYRRSSRIQVDVTYHVELGFLYRNKEMEPGKLISQMESMVKKMMGKRYCTAVCVGVSFDPLYGAEELRTKNQFTSVVNLTLRDVETWE